MTLAYRELGAGPPVLLLHGWPTSSFLWRDVMAPIARANRVIALDLPGFGGSDKPRGRALRLRASSSGRSTGFLDALEIDEVGLAVHDLGGPIGVHWAVGRPERRDAAGAAEHARLPRVLRAVIEFVSADRTPGSASELTSPEGLDEVMRLGLADPSRMPAR